MRINFNNGSRPLSAAKLLARRTGHVRLSAAQEAIAKAAGYRDWHELHRSSGGPSSQDPVTPDRAKALVLSVVDALDVSLGEAQYALSRARLFTFTLEENLQLRASLWRERLFGPAGRGKVGTLVMVQALRGKEVGYLKPGGDGYDQLLYDSGFGSCGSSEVIYPRGATEDFAPSVLWLPYGYWKRAKVGLALLDLLPKALKSGCGLHDSTTIIGVLVAGLGLYLLIHRLPAGRAVSRVTLLLHSLMDGLGIGLAFQISPSTGWLIAAAVLAHDMADGANMVGMNLTDGQLRKAHLWLLANAIAPLAGVAIGQAVRVDLGEFALVLALFAGGFLYIGASELLPRSRTASAGWHSAFASVAGLAVMACIVHLAR